MILWLLTTLAATCGQKGPLYLPEDSPEESASASSSKILTARLRP